MLLEHVVEGEERRRDRPPPGRRRRRGVVRAAACLRQPPPVRRGAPRRGQRARRPPRHLPRGSKFPGGGQAPPARKLVFVEEDDVDAAAGLALLALARCA